MNLKDTIRGAAIASAVAGLFSCAAQQAPSASPGPGAAGGEMVKCTGVNECAGKGQCGGADHDCAGKNACKGKGWIKMLEADCEEKGGTVM